MLIRLVDTGARWDASKSAETAQKREIEFLLFKELLSDGSLVWSAVRSDVRGEHRYKLCAMLSQMSMIVVVATWRSGCWRIISMRKGNKREKKRFRNEIVEGQKPKGK